MIDAARKAGVRRFVHISSLAAREPDLSDYGWSKAQVGAAGRRLRASTGRSSARPPSTAPATARRSNCSRWPGAASSRCRPSGRFSVIHVEDLCRLILAVLDEPDTLGETYEPDDGTRERLGPPPFRAHPRPPLRQARRHRRHAEGRCCRAPSRLDRLVRRGRAKLTPDRVRYFCHPDWVVDRRGAARPQRSGRPQIRTPTGLKADRRMVSRAGLAALDRRGNTGSTKAAKLATSPTQEDPVGIGRASGISCAASTMPVLVDVARHRPVDAVLGPQPRRSPRR